MRLPAFFLLALLLACPVAGATSPEDAGRELAAELGCAACHSGLDVSVETRTRAPDLSYAGVRYQPGYLLDYLRHPGRVRRHIGASRMPDFQLDEKEALALTLFLAAQRSEPDAARATPGASNATVGAVHASNADDAALVGDLREHSCLSCHTWQGVGGERGPELSDFGARLEPEWVRRFLRSPAAYGVPDGVMPALFFQVDEHGAGHETVPGALLLLQRIVDAGAALARSVSKTRAEQLAAARARHPEIDAAAGERVFRALNCAACHAIAGVEARPDDAPDLAGEGIRVREPWLRDYLTTPVTIRPAGGAPGSASRMPDFHLTTGEVAAFTALLMQRRQGVELLRPGFVPEPLGAPALQKARTLLRDKLACLGCHRLGDAGGVVGPDLSSVATRLEPAFVEAMVRAPQQLVAHVTMPKLPMPERTRDLLVRYLVQQTEPRTSARALSPLDASFASAAADDPGAALYGRNCAPCHGVTGNGDGFNAPYLPVRPTVHADARYLATRGDDTLYDGIAAGAAVLDRSHFMPAWGETLTSTQIDALVRHLRELCRCEGPAWSLRTAAADGGRTVDAAASSPGAAAAATIAASASPRATPVSPAQQIIFPAPLPTPPTPAIFYKDFVGAAACRPCHAEQYDLWARSTHGHAGGLPGAVDLIARFDGKPLVFKDAYVMPEQKADGGLSFTVKHQHGSTEKIEVAAVVGGGHMIGGGTQSFFARLPDGTLRFLPFDFIRQESVWFAQLRSDASWAPIDGTQALADLANWPPVRILGNAPQFSNCDVCHGSQIQVLPGANRTVQTRFQSLAINCESCHGPGRRHVEWAAAPNRDALPDDFMPALDTYAKDASLRVCFQCHASRPTLDPDYLPGRSYDDHFALKFWLLEADPYFPDGRIRTFSYQDNHQFSDCYVSGSMTCVDCHDPHSQKYRDVFGRKLDGRFADGQCTACHPSKAVLGERHTHHAPGSPGAACTACHMPFLQEPTVGKLLRFARSDHTIPIPRPAFDASLGIDNACSQCHRDKSVAALQEKTEQWWGPIKPHPAVVDATIAAEQVTQRPQAAALLLRPGDRHVIAQFAALASFARRFLDPDAPVEPEVVALLEELTRSADVDVSSLALASLHFARGRDDAVRRFLAAALAGLGPRDRAVRLRWASALSTIGIARAKAGVQGVAAVTREKIKEVLPFGTQDRLWSAPRVK